MLRNKIGVALASCILTLCLYADFIAPSSAQVAGPTIKTPRLTIGNGALQATANGDLAVNGDFSLGGSVTLDELSEADIPTISTEFIGLWDTLGVGGVRLGIISTDSDGITLEGEDGSGAEAGKGVALIGGTGGATDAPGGDIQISAGDGGGGNSNGGGVNIVAGAKTGSGTAGVVAIDGSILLNGLAVTTGSFTITWDDACTTSPTSLVNYTLQNAVVTWSIGPFSATCTGDSTTMGTTSAIVPAAIRPATDTVIPYDGIGSLNNGASVNTRCIRVKANGTVDVPSSAICSSLVAWTAAGNRSLNTVTAAITYRLN